MISRWPTLLTALMVACGHADAPHTHRPLELRLAVAAPPEPAPPAEPAPSVEARPALEGAPLERLDLGGGEEAWLALPVGARDRRAIVVGVHGAGDRPDWACREWQAVTAGWAIVVCPQSRWTHPADAHTYVWGSAAQIASSADRAVAAVRTRFGPWVLDAPLVYAGWSQGGTLAGEVVRSRPGVYDRAVLVEVGHTALDAEVVAASLRAGGVERAVVACESPKCRSFAAAFARAARRRGLALGAVDVGFRAHLFDEPLVRPLVPQVASMFEDDARFAGLGAAIDARWATD